VVVVVAVVVVMVVSQRGVPRRSHLACSREALHAHPWLGVCSNFVGRRTGLV